MLLARSYTLWKTMMWYFSPPRPWNPARSHSLSAVASVLFSAPLILLWSASTLVELCVTSWLLSYAGWSTQVDERQCSSSLFLFFKSHVDVHTLDGFGTSAVFCTVVCRAVSFKKDVTKICLKDSATIADDNSTTRFVALCIAAWSQRCSKILEKLCSGRASERYGVKMLWKTGSLKRVGNLCWLVLHLRKKCAALETR